MTPRASLRLRAVLFVSALTLTISGCGTSPRHAAQAKPSAAETYAALGDSYTAFPGTATQINAPCLRSSQNYPHLLAARLGYRLVDVSCSGATTTNFTSPQNPSTPPQFSALSAKTRLVTVGVGANDLQLSSLLLGGCVLLRDVPAAGNDPCEVRTFAEATHGLERLVPTLTATFQAVRARAPKARVIVVGYPQILGTSGSCASFPLAPGDVAYVNAINTQLNAALQRAAAVAKVEFLDIASASMSHGICSPDPWINGINIAAGRAFPVHPFANEQRAVAHLLEARLAASSGRSPSG